MYNGLFIINNMIHINLLIVGLLSFIVKCNGLRLIIF
ncbi:unnamed protein product [Commensalibacter communis]|uniref:Uncharacterized protein n=1 Tax=Commensalibacter communis TaxID=2972786 RepID=A0A9W4TQH9_9PROT|nr:unnamed protein product [Commensalibacter communis]CAI3950706.1 unnamed protein product [Commensalibacter communis]CAI3952570.1 unnamed protein product [Commensalibacter communis]CAI3954480.1 unnamed protein product [Commensalibacter communis]CAI3954601.1 unnamed protein product [Commensalibacter communis]